MGCGASTPVDSVVEFDSKGKLKGGSREPPQEQSTRSTRSAEKEAIAILDAALYDDNNTSSREREEDETTETTPTTPTTVNEVYLATSDNNSDPKVSPQIPDNNIALPEESDKTAAEIDTENKAMSQMIAGNIELLADPADEADDNSDDSTEIIHGTEAKNLDTPPAPRSPGNTDHEPMHRMNVSQGDLLSDFDDSEPEFFDEDDYANLVDFQDNAQDNCVEQTPQTPEVASKPKATLSGNPSETSKKSSSSKKLSEGKSKKSEPLKNLQGELTVDNKMNPTKTRSQRNLETRGSSFRKGRSKRDLNNSSLSKLEVPQKTKSKRNLNNSMPSLQMEDSASDSDSSTSSDESSSSMCSEDEEQDGETANLAIEEEVNGTVTKRAKDSGESKKKKKDSKKSKKKKKEKKSKKVKSERKLPIGDADEGLVEGKIAWHRAAIQRMGDQVRQKKLAEQLNSKKSKRKANKQRSATCYDGKLKGKYANSAEKLFDLLNLDPLDNAACDQSGNSQLDHVTIEALIDETPEICWVKYFFDAFAESAFPLSMLCALGAPITTIQKCHGVHPGAMDHPDEWLGTALHYACVYQVRLEVVEFLMREDPDAAAECNFFLRTPLHMACLFKASTDVILAVLESYKMAAQKTDRQGDFPLHLACLGNGSSIIDPEALKPLIAAFPLACLARSSNGGSTPLHLALAVSEDGSPSSSSSSFESEPLAMLPVIKVLVKGHAAALEVVDEHGNIPMHVAVMSSSTIRSTSKKHYSDQGKVVKFLAKSYPRSITSRNKKGETPLDVSQPGEIRKILLKQESKQ